MLAIALWGTLLGGVVYSHLVFFPVYLSALPDSAGVSQRTLRPERRNLLGDHSPLLLVSLTAALVLNWNSPPAAHRRQLSVYVAILLISLFYFVPELVLFRNSPQSTVPPAEWLARGRRWQRLSWLRGLIAYIMYVPLLLALTKPAGDNRELVP